MPAVLSKKASENCQIPKTITVKLSIRPRPTNQPPSTPESLALPSNPSKSPNQSPSALPRSTNQLHSRPGPAGFDEEDPPPLPWKYNPRVFFKITDEHTFRVLFIKNGELNDPIRCDTYPDDLRLCSTSHWAPLSYKWDEPGGPLIEISLNQVKFHVSETLHEALKHLRAISTSGKGRLLSFWVDALCIDMQDPEDVKAQFGRMERIFKTAETVLEWTGKETEEGLISVFRMINNPTAFLNN